MLGTLLVIIAMGFSVYADLSNPNGLSSQVWLILVPVLVGVGVSLQAALSGLLRAAAHSAMTATFISFLVGTVILVAVATVSVLLQGWPTEWPSQPLYYAGGPLGVLFIALAAILVRTAGVLLLSMSNVAGQLVASVALEAGLPLAGGVSAGLFAGAAIALVAVLVATLPSRVSG